ARLGDARLPDVGEAEEPLLACVNRVVGVGGKEDRGVRVATQDAAYEFHDRGRLAGAWRALDEVELARPQSHDAGDRLRLLRVGIRKVVRLLAVQGDLRRGAEPARVSQLRGERAGARAADLVLPDDRPLGFEHLAARGRQDDAFVRPGAVAAEADPQVRAVNPSRSPSHSLTMSSFW